MQYLKKNKVRVTFIPWFTFASTKWLQKKLRKNMLVFEWGSGGSTLFLSSKVSKVISIEGDLGWYNFVKKVLRNRRINNCEQFLEKNLDKHPGLIKKYPDNYFDLVIIDGEKRNECIIEAKGKITPGGWILLDNSERTEYQKGIAHLSNWEKKEFYGPGPYNNYFWQTSVFQKPCNKK